MASRGEITVRVMRWEMVLVDGSGAALVRLQSGPYVAWRLMRLPSA